MRPQLTYKLQVFFLILITLGSYSCETESLTDENFSESKAANDNASNCVATNKSNLYAGQHILVGYVSIKTNNGYNEITYNITNKNYCLTSTHLSVVLKPSDFPMTKSGNPINGRFEFGDDKLDCVDNVTYLVPESRGTYIAAHAVVAYNGGSLESSNQETAWANGCDFPGNNWATYFKYFSPNEW